MAVSKILTNAIAVKAAVLFSPSAPANITNTSPGVMLGLGGTCKVTPGATGRLQITLCGASAVSVATASFTHQLRYGTGSAPANGAALTGTTVGNVMIGWSDAVNSPTPWSITVLVTGLTPGTQYWFDISSFVSTGSGGTQSLNFTAIEY
jgi:hypothetical protein